MPDTYEVKIRPEKVEAVREIAERLARAEAVLLTEYRGLTVTELAALRSALRRAEVEYKVVKNTLARLAARDRGLEGLDGFLEGPTAVAFCFGDPVSGTKALTDFAKLHPALVIKGGFIEGRVMSADQAKGLATVDQLDVSRAKISWSLTSALQTMVGALEGALRQIIYVLENLPAGAAPGPESAPAEPGAGGEAGANGGGEANPEGEGSEEGA